MTILTPKKKNSVNIKNVFNTIMSQSAYKIQAYKQHNFNKIKKLHDGSSYCVFQWLPWRLTVPGKLAR